MRVARHYNPLSELVVDEIKFVLGNDRQNKTVITMMQGPTCMDVAIVTPACVTNWPRCTGDGNFGTMWGPTDVTKAKFSLDLTDQPINMEENTSFGEMAQKLETIDDKLLDFVHNNQLKVLGRKNLSRDEVKMLQIRSVRPKYDKLSGSLIGHNVQLTTPKYHFDGMGGKYPKAINICDMNGGVVPNGQVAPGDVVAATMFANQVYTGVGGDKFGIHWSFEDVQIICQRHKLESKTEVSVFQGNRYDYACQYQDPTAESQFPDVVAY